MTSAEQFDILMIFFFFFKWTRIISAWYQVRKLHMKASQFLLKPCVCVLYHHIFRIQDICIYNLSNAVHKHYSWVFCVCISHQQNDNNLQSYYVVVLHLLDANIEIPHGFQEIKTSG